MENIMSQYHAQCHCKKISVISQGAPNFVSMCHCQDCQRRTGSAFNLGAWFDKSKIKITGKIKTFTIIEHEGIEMTYHFCPDCGSSVYWSTPILTSALGIALGCFEDSQFAIPTSSFHENNRFNWVTVPQNANRFVEDIKSDRVS